MQNTIGVTTQGLLQIIDNKMMHNCPIDRQSVNDALHIYGQSISNLLRKSTRSTQGHVILNNVCPIPPMLLTRHQNIILGIDVVKVN